MENERKEYKEKKSTDKQIFYFNDKGQLVVESNKGVWVDGEKFVKMYGDFTCNAKTMGEIIHQLKGIAVEVGVEAVYSPKEHVVYCVLGASKERIEEYERELGEEGDRIYELKKSIENFNKLPWWKRIFKKVEVK